VSIYRRPKYYEIAFGSLNVGQQVDTFEKIIEKFSKIKVNRFLDIACGPSKQLIEIARRGYEAVGLDLSTKMLKYLSEKADKEHLSIDTVCADMCDFRLRQRADFAFIMMGSLALGSNSMYLNHLRSVARSLNKGGLYFIQNKIVDWMDTGNYKWVAKERGTSVRVTLNTYWKDILRQILSREVVLEVNENGNKKRFKMNEDLKFVFPEEFKLLIKLSGGFDFLGWWEGNGNTWFLDKPLDKSEALSNNNMVLLRRR